MESMDANNDGYISQKEMYAYVASEIERHRNDLNSTKQDFQRRETELQQTIERLETENCRLKELYSRSSLPNNCNLEVSDERIREIAQSLIDDPKTNIRGLPDFAERRIYQNIFKLLLSSLAGMSESSHILVAGHRIRWSITPEEPDNTPQPASAN